MCWWPAWGREGGGGGGGGVDTRSWAVSYMVKCDWLCM